MFHHALPRPQHHPGQVTGDFEPFPSDGFVPEISDDHILMGEIAYQFLVREADSTSGRHFFGLPPLPGDTFGTAGPLSPASSSTGYVAFPHAMNDFPSFPQSTTVSQTSTPDYHQVSPGPSPPPGPGCRQSTPRYDKISGKWICNACGIDFTNEFDCGRHIGYAGKRSECLACGKSLMARRDNWRRHLRVCQGDIGNLPLEDAFVEI